MRQARNSDAVRSAATLAATSPVLPGGGRSKRRRRLAQVRGLIAGDGARSRRRRELELDVTMLPADAT